MKQKRAKWMTTEIIDLIRQRDHYFRKYKKSNLQADFDKYVYNRNQARYHIQKAKADYYAEVVTENIHQPKKLWKILKDIGAGKTNSNSCNTGIDIDNAICFDKNVISNHFNTFFLLLLLPIWLHIYQQGLGSLGYPF